MVSIPGNKNSRLVKYGADIAAKILNQASARRQLMPRKETEQPDQKE